MRGPASTVIPFSPARRRSRALRSASAAHGSLPTRRGDYTGHPREPHETTVEQGVVQWGAALDRRTRGHADYVHNGNVFGVTAGDTVKSRQLAHPMGSDERADAAARPGVSVRGVGGVELVRRSRPVDALYREQFVE